MCCWLTVPRLGENEKAGPLLGLQRSCLGAERVVGALVLLLLLAIVLVAVVVVMVSLVARLEWARVAGDGLPATSQRRDVSKKRATVAKLA